MMKIYKNQEIAIGNKGYSSRMRQYLNKQFPETQGINDDELETIILDLTDKAAGYKLILETQVAPFIVACWIMGISFDQNFISAREVLENLDMDSNEKANWLWQFLEETIGILEGNSPKLERTI